MIITIDDIRQAGHCTKGARRWFETNKLDFRQFLESGLECQEILDTGDDLARQIVEHARARRG